MRKAFRGIRVLLGAALLLNQIGCASKHPHSGRILLANPDSFASNVRLLYPNIYKIDGSMGGQSYDWLSPGKHIITVNVNWSNWYADNTDLVVNVVDDGIYIVYAIEVPESHKDTIYVELQSTGEFVEYLLLYCIGLGFAWIFGLPYLAYSGVKYIISPPKRRPGGKQCYVWIEDRDTRRLISGKRPDNLVDRSGHRLSGAMYEPNGY